MSSESRPRPPTMIPDDELVREPLYPQTRPPRPPQSAGRIVLLSALAALLVLTIAGASALVVRDLRLPQASRTSAPVAATATSPSGTPTPESDPQGNGWTVVSGGVFSDVQFTQGSGRRGYLCGKDAGTSRRLVGVTTDGGTTWQIGPSPAGYDACSVQVSPTNPLDVVLLSSVDCHTSGGCTGFDAHYSTDGGKTWRAAPFPANTQLGGVGAVWAGTHLYIWADPTPENPQQGLLKVSANGGAFTAIDPNALVPGASDVIIYHMVAGGTTVYVTLAYTGCSAQGCTAVVASADGGKTWSRITDILNMYVWWAAGNTLYGAVAGPQASGLQTSTDNGANWQPLALPPLPDGSPVAVYPDIPGHLLPAADGTIFVLDRAGTLAYLHAGAWTVLPFSSYGVGALFRMRSPFGTVTFGPDGRPVRVWVFSSLGTDGSLTPTLYRRDVQIA